MAQNITIAGASYSDVPALNVPKAGGGTAKFVDTSEDTVTEWDLYEGITAHDADGNLIEGVLVPGVTELEVKNRAPVGSIDIGVTVGQKGQKFIAPQQTELFDIEHGDQVKVTPIFDTGTAYITANGSYTPSYFGPYMFLTGVTVDVPQGVVPEGDIELTQQSGTDVTEYETASVREGVLSVSASKGAVSGHAVTVTPSASVSPGWVDTGATGTPVTVTAAELVSGSETKTANGTYDVTTLAQLVVAIPYYEGW